MPADKHEWACHLGLPSRCGVWLSSKLLVAVRPTRSVNDQAGGAPNHCFLRCWYVRGILRLEHYDGVWAVRNRPMARRPIWRNSEPRDVIVVGSEYGGDTASHCRAQRCSSAGAHSPASWFRDAPTASRPRSRICASYRHACARRQRCRRSSLDQCGVANCRRTIDDFVLGEGHRRIAETPQARKPAGAGTAAKPYRPRPVARIATARGGISVRCGVLAATAGVGARYGLLTPLLTQHRRVAFTESASGTSTDRPARTGCRFSRKTAGTLVQPAPRATSSARSEASASAEIDGVVGAR